RRTIKAPPSLLDGKGGAAFYTLAIFTGGQTPPRTPETYPQGCGFASFTLPGTGAFTLVGVLADGTKVSQGASLVEGYSAPVFIQLTTPGASTKKGAFSGHLQFAIEQPHRDISSAGCLWIRPTVLETRNAVTQPYTSGWPGGIAATVAGARYDKTLSIQSALGLNVAPAGISNARLEFGGGRQLESVATTQLNLTGSRIAKIPLSNTSFSLVITPSTGLISGTFTPTWTNPSRTRPAFQGILIQGGPQRGGHGFFLSNRLGDTDPESGYFLLHKP
ncbi:MAG TPA: hypothetical protein VD994_17630, partial [Prosthecobacter sp.]|nr:hypothetical protein [Prosthecobacter sp.]